MMRCRRLPARLGGVTVSMLVLVASLAVLAMLAHARARLAARRGADEKRPRRLRGADAARGLSQIEEYLARHAAFDDYLSRRAGAKAERRKTPGRPQGD
jgi:hypothetical protein